MAKIEDAELILLGYALFYAMSLKNVVLRISQFNSFVGFAGD